VGHGIAAALLMAKVAAESRFALATSQSAAMAMAKMNTSLSDLNIDRFVTLALCLLNVETHKMTIVNAGHMAPIIRRADGTIEELAIEHSGLPLGILEDYQYEAVEWDFHPGDVLIMYTDGINEAMNAKEEQLTTAAMIEELKNSQAKTAVAIGELLHDTVNRHIGSVSPIDDMCLICIGRKSVEKAISPVSEVVTHRVKTKA
jgi:phosphoserine phosphatase RsbU/P